MIEEEIEEPQPDTEDAFLSPSGTLGGKILVSMSGKVIGEFIEEDEALAALYGEMKRQSYWPNVWKIDDHGGHLLIDMTAFFAKFGNA